MIFNGVVGPLEVALLSMGLPGFMTNATEKPGSWIHLGGVITWMSRTGSAGIKGDRTSGLFHPKEYPIYK